MVKNVLTVIMVLSTTFIFGCSGITNLRESSPSSSKGPEIVRQAEIGPDWEMNQMRIVLEAGEQLSVLLKLNNGDKTDGYFYIEDGGSIAFQIEGNQLFYQSQPEGTAGGVTSDRFSFTANPAQGNTYTLTFSNAEGETQPQATIFLEVIYPLTASVYIPVNTE